MRAFQTHHPSWIEFVRHRQYVQLHAQAYEDSLCLVTVFKSFGQTSDASASATVSGSL